MEVAKLKGKLLVPNRICKRKKKKNQTIRRRTQGDG